VYTTWTAPDEVATEPAETAELTFTLNDAAKAAAEMPPVALTPPVAIAPDDSLPVTLSVTLADDHVTPAGPPGANVTWTTFAGPPNW
jgi:hypothetical protein